MGNVCPCGAGPAKLVTSQSNKMGMSTLEKTASIRSTGGASIKLPNNSGKHPEDFYDMEKKPVGTGAFGAVRISKHKQSKQQVAIKTIEKRAIKDQAAFRNEVQINIMMDHPNIARLFETFEDSRHVYLAMELCRGGEMFDLIIDAGYFSEKHAAIFMEQILRALLYMHTNGVAHRDLKPENFLLMCKHKSKEGDGGVKIEDNTLKVIDFGIAKTFPKPKEGEDGPMCLTTKAGTAYYIAPEVLSGKYNEKCDIWSAGVILYILLSGSPPFGGDDDQSIIRAAKKGKLDFRLEEFSKVDQKAKKLIQNMVKLDVKSRFNASKALSDPWVQQPKGVSREDTNEHNLFSTQLLSNLKKFTHVNRFKKECLNVMAHRLEDGQLKKLRDGFQRLDTDGNGMLTLKELKEGCAKAGLVEDAELTYVFEHLDNDNSGSISYSEFLAAMVDQKHMINRPLAWEAFRIFDLNGDGKIKVDEFVEILKTSEDLKLLPGDLQKKEDTELRSMFNEADSNKNGEIDFEEFYVLLTS